MSNEVATVDNKGLQEFTIKDFSEKAAEQLKGLKLQYPILKIPSGGALYFEIDDEAVKELVGVIIHHGPRNIYYATEFDGQNSPPDCSSNDGITGFELIPDAGEGEEQYTAKLCAECPFNKYGSDRSGNGKACKEKHQLYILINNKLIPFSFLLPVSSTTPLNAYATRLFNNGQFLNEVLTSFTLEKATSKGGIVYSKLVLKKLRDLTEDELKVIEMRGDQVKRDTNNG